MEVAAQEEEQLQPRPGGERPGGHVVDAQESSAQGQRLGEGSAEQGDGVEDEGEICRICRSGREDGRPLYHPCICTGSIKFVHEDCLMEWLSYSSQNSNRSKCELCGHRFGFTPVYEEGAPSSLSTSEFASLCVVRGVRSLPFGVRLVVVGLTWGIFIPIATCVMFRILSLGKLDRTGLYDQLQDTSVGQSGWSRLFARLCMALDGGVYTSWGVGVCATASIFMSFVTLVSVVDFVREHEMLNEHLEEHDMEDEDDNIFPANEEPVGDLVNYNDVVDPAAPPDAALEHVQEERDREREQEMQEQEEDERQGQDPVEAPAHQREEQRPEERAQGHQQAVMDNDDMDWALVAAQALPAVVDAAQEPNPLEEDGDAPAPEEQELLDDEDDEDEHEGDLNVALDELLGLRGPGWVLFHNVLWLLTFNGLYLCVALFAPTTVGAVIMSVFARLAEATTGVQLLSKKDEAYLLRTLHRLRGEERVRSLHSHQWSLVHQGGLWSVAGLDPVAAKSEIAALEAEVRLQELSRLNLPMVQNGTLVCGLGDKDVEGRDKFFEELHWIGLEVGAVLIGYSTVALVLSLMFNTSKWLRDRAAGRSSSFRTYSRVTRVLKLMSRTFKVVIIVFLKMGVFPVLLGALLEFAGRDLVDLGDINRYSFASDHPVYAIMILWVAGITHMLVITVIVLELRDVLHPDILHGIIRPKDADDSLLRTVLEEPLLKHMRRMALSCAIYTFLVAAFIFVPAHIIKESGYREVLPYTPALKYTLLEVQLPIELLCIHIGVLNVLDQSKEALRDAITAWLRVTCGALGLTRFILPVPAEDESEGTARHADGEDNVREEEEREGGHQEREQEDADDGEEDDGPLGAQQGEPEPDAAEPALLPRQTPSLWMLRILVISALAWTTCLAATVAVVTSPLFLGRATVSLLQIPVQHEPLIYGIGCVVLWRAVVAAYVAQVHRAPAAISNLLHLVFDRSSVPQSWMRSLIDWFQTGLILLLLQPWAIGVVVQMLVLLPAEIFQAQVDVYNRTSSPTSFRYQVGLLHKALGGAMAVGNHSIGSEVPVMANPVEVLWSSTPVGASRASPVVSASPMHDWMVGMIIQLIATQVLFLLPDLVNPEDRLGRLYTSVSEAVHDAVHHLDCIKLLDLLVTSFCSVLLVFTLPMGIWGVVDGVIHLTGPESAMRHTHGLVYQCRWTIVVLALSIAVPFVAMEAHRTCRRLHDALRDERYLIGKRLHNMEQTQRAFSKRRSVVF
ncbi:Probable E3 ubiquitin ligase SUD1 (Protein ECERIFERUM 9) (Protein SUPPRESSOR OF DRY2 DEFFECTS 1) (AtSUD1) (RING-type E3 ubiquitin transferase SUD1) (RING/U-box domain-containing protein) [Durusdinium trenchii]|uniref:RING-type E3 ubiquitin transferase n=1 Tax=Durusdinium trenchii TaxID=1381693 RepID=A0ABP0JCJ2_9DINO